MYHSILMYYTILFPADCLFTFQPRIYCLEDNMFQLKHRNMQFGIQSFVCLLSRYNRSGNLSIWFRCYLNQNSVSRYFYLDAASSKGVVKFDVSFGCAISFTHPPTTLKFVPRFFISCRGLSVSVMDIKCTGWWRKYLKQFFSNPQLFRLLWKCTFGQYIWNPKRGAPMIREHSPIL